MADNKENTEEKIEEVAKKAEAEQTKEEKKEEPKFKQPDEKKTKKKGKKVIIALILLIIVAIGGALTWFAMDTGAIGNPVKKFEKYLFGNEISNAKAVYKDNIKGNSDREKEAEAIVKKYLEETIKQYNEEKIDYDDAEKNFNNIDRIDSKLYEKVALDILERLENLQTSKKAFEKAKDYIDKGDYREAGIELAKVIKEDKNYEEAQKLLEETVSSATNAVIKEAEDYFEKGNFVKAFEILEEEIEVSQDKKVLEEKLKELKKRQVQIFIEEAEELITENKWEQAKVKLESALELEPSNRSAKAKLEELNKNMPVRLDELNVLTRVGAFKDVSSYYGSSYYDKRFYHVDRMVDNYGEAWENVIKFFVTRGTSHSSSYIELNLQQRYKSFAGKLVVSEGNGSESAKVQVKIYADGTELASYDFDRDTKAIDINLDLNYTKTLKISVMDIGGGSDYFELFFADAYVRND